MSTIVILAIAVAVAVRIGAEVFLSPKPQSIDRKSYRAVKVRTVLAVTEMIMIMIMIMKIMVEAVVPQTALRE